MAVRRLTVTLLCLALVGCARPLPAAGTPGDPVRLVGMWSVTGPSVDPGVILRLDADELVIFAACGQLSGQWRADVAGDFVADTFGFSDACAPAPQPPWLAATRGFTFEGADVLLTDGAGMTTARLRAGGVPSLPPELASAYADPPASTDQLRQTLTATPVLPAGLTPAVDLLGRWVPAGQASAAFLSFAADGSWEGSDGCNGNGGRWLIGDGARLLATSGIQHLIGCDNVDVGSWPTAAVSVGFDGDVLVLVGPNGTETGRLRAAD